MKLNLPSTKHKKPTILRDWKTASNLCKFTSLDSQPLFSHHSWWRGLIHKDSPTKLDWNNQTYRSETPTKKGGGTPPKLASRTNYDRRPSIHQYKLIQKKEYADILKLIFGKITDFSDSSHQKVLILEINHSGITQLFARKSALTCSSTDRLNNF